MEAKEILEGNKLIAEFMSRTYHFIEDLSYESSWEWLMPVVEKIAKIEIKECPVLSNGEDTFYDSYYLRTFGVVSSETKEFMVRINRFSLHCSKSLIEATWQAVIQFIHWYNTNKTK